VKTILITGASGFIGSFLVEEALNKGGQTWAGIRKSSNREYLQDARIQFIDLNFADKEHLKKQILAHVEQYGPWDYIIHNAGITKCLDTADFEKVNYLFTRHFVEALRETNAIPEKFILMSSLSAIYPDTAYGKSKRKAEQFLEAQTAFPFIILRPTGVYGPREKDYYLMLKAIKNGLDVTAGFETQKLTFIYVKDLVKAAFLALENPIKNKTYVVADGNVYSDDEYTRIAKNALGKKVVLKMRIPLALLKTVCIISEALSKLTGKPATLNRDKYNIMKQRDWTCDTRPIETDLGFKAGYDLKRGMQECVKWYRTNGWLHLAIIFIFFFSMTGCKGKNTVPLPQPQDFSLIQEKGELNVLTLSGSMSYFIYKGEPRGYEYELLNDFAESYHLKLNIKLAENETKLTEMLQDEKGDLIAYNIPVTNEGKKDLLYAGRKVINQQVLIQRSNKNDTLLKDVTELIGKDVWVIHDSKYYRRLKNLNDELGGGINIRIIDKDTISVEDLIEMVSKGKISYTVSDADMAKLNKTYFHNINISLEVSHPQRSSWAVRKTSSELAAVINQWFDENQNNPRYKAIIKRYFEMSKMPGDEPAPLLHSHQISPYDNYFKEYAKQIGWDWQLLASISFQESKFHLDRVSWAGATGLMGLMPKTAEAMGISPEEMIQPETSILAAIRLIKRLNKSFSSIENKEERIKFILAAYNSGSGHIYDAQALAKKYGKDPALWEENVEECLKLKNLPEYYNDPVVKQGYFRGTETINYVHSVIERWLYYKENVN
jgi:membrane-bound lytic murein transglycosylase F